MKQNTTIVFGLPLSVEELAERLTLAGLEVGSIRYVGVEGADLVWDREKLVLGHLLKVEQHPQADRLVLATLDIGAAQPEKLPARPNCLNLSVRVISVPWVSNRPL